MEEFYEGGNVRFPAFSPCDRENSVQKCASRGVFVAKVLFCSDDGRRPRDGLPPHAGRSEFIPERLISQSRRS